MYCHECRYELPAKVNFCSDCGAKQLTNNIVLKKEVIIKPINTQPELITVKELEKLLNVSQSRAYELIHSKGFPTVKIGRLYRVNKTKLLEMIDRGYVF